MEFRFTNVFLSFSPESDSGNNNQAGVSLAAAPQAPALTHVTKSRPIQKGKRAPTRKPPAKTFDEEVMSSGDEV